MRHNQATKAAFGRGTTTRRRIIAGQTAGGGGATSERYVGGALTAAHFATLLGRQVISVSLALLSFCLLRADAVQTQANAPEGTAIVSGRVIDGTTKAVVPGAMVQVQRDVTDGIRLPRRDVVADAQGRFVITGLPAGSYWLGAVKSGWITGSYGMDSPSIPEPVDRYALKLQSGERATATVAIWRKALLTGRVLTESGEPVAGARVSATQWGVRVGRRLLGSGQLAIADEQGMFFLEARPGDYYLLARADEGHARGVTATDAGARFTMKATFYPSSPEVAGALMLSVKAGEVRDELDIRLPVVPARRVSGVIRSVDGVDLPVRIALTSLDDSRTVQRPNTLVGRDGRFVLNNVAEGKYLLSTTTGRGWVHANVDVGASDLEIVIGIQRNLRVSGRVQFDPGDQAATAKPWVLLRQEADGADGDTSPPPVPISADGQFTAEVTPGRYIVTAGASGWVLHSAMSGTVDLADTPLLVTRDVSGIVVTLANRSAEVRGRVSPLEGGAGSTLVALFPADESLWVDFGVGRRHRLVRPAADGSFSFPQLAAGDYLLTAVRDALESDIRYGALYEELAPRATRVHLAEGGVASHDLRAIVAPTARVASRPPVLPLGPVEVAESLPVPPVATRGGTISGRVVDALTNAPVGAMRLSLRPNLDNGTFSDEEGRFLLTDVAAGQHTVFTAKPGYVPIAYGARDPNDAGTPISVAAGQQVTDIVVAVMKGASITGTVVDLNGEPVPEVEINVLRSTWLAQGRQFLPIRNVTQLMAPRTDLLGRFRVSQLPPGEYVVEARPLAPGFQPLTVTTQADVDYAAGKRSTAPGATRVGVLAPQFYPDVEDVRRGDRLRLAAGEERILRFGVEAVVPAQITGTIVGPDGQPLAKVSGQLFQSDSALPRAGSGTRSFASDSAGAFTIESVPPGRYTLATSTSGTAAASGAGLSASLELAVAGDVEGVVLRVQPARTISGRVRLDTGGVPSAPGGLRLTATRIGAPVGASNASVAATWDAEGRITFKDLQPGHYRLTLLGQQATIPRLMAQTVNGRPTPSTGIDLTDVTSVSDLEVVISTTPSTVAGFLRDRAGRPATGIFVVLFAEQPEAWTPLSAQVFAAQPDQEGRFSFRNVPPGAYRIAPLVDSAPNQWFDPQLLASLVATSTPITVGSADIVDLDVRAP